MNILVGVTGSIAAYKAASLISVLVDKDHDVRVIMTENSKKFIGPLTLSSLCNHSLYDDDEGFSQVNTDVLHIELATWADRFIICPATYNTINKIIIGITNNLLTDTVVPYMGMNKKLCIAPAMNTHMWTMLKCKSIYNSCKMWNIELIEPVEGKLACGTTGVGKLAPTKIIVEKLLESE